MLQTREQVIKHLAAASLSGTLGLFIGAGFSKALTRGRAPSWGTLLQLAARNLELPDPLAIPIVGQSYPGIATRMATDLAAKLAASTSPAIDVRKEAIQQLKLEVSRQTTLIAEPDVAATMGDAIRAIDPSWIVTTNYDFLIEHCMDHPVSLLPDQVLHARRGTVPVFHLHGHLLRPNDIVLLEEDYVQTLAQPGYRHVRLGVLFAESTTLMLGYALGDVNVQTAIHYSSAYRPSSSELTSIDVGHVVFLNRASPPDVPPRRGIWNEVIIDGAEIIDFLTEIVAARVLLSDYWSRIREFMSTAVADARWHQQFVDSPKARKAFIAAIQTVPAASSLTDIANFLLQSLKAIAMKASAIGGWKYYKPWLETIVDVLQAWPLGQLPPVLLEQFARELNSIAAHIEPSGSKKTGYAWEITEMWHNLKHDLFSKRPELLRALRQCAERLRYDKLFLILPSSS